jgi:hypothetical protein
MAPRARPNRPLTTEMRSCTDTCRRPSACQRSPVLICLIKNGVLDGEAYGSWYGLSPESANVTLTRIGSGPGPNEIHVAVTTSKSRDKLNISSGGSVVQVDVKRK